MIPDEAVEAAAQRIAELRADGAKAAMWRTDDVAALVEAVAADPHLMADVDLMRWKLDALRKWADAMIDESYYPQYGRDAKTVLDVSSMDEAREIDAL